MKFWFNNYKMHYIFGPFSHKICTDLRGVRNSEERGRNLPIGRKKYTLKYFISLFPRLHLFFFVSMTVDGTSNVSVVNKQMVK